MLKVIFDCDNTMGIYGKDVDDGLALLYLLGSSQVNLLGVTTTYGNSNIEDVYENTVKMLREDLGIKHIPVLKGAPGKESRNSEAALFLAQSAAKYPGEITILATGSLTNLYAAYELDKNFFNNIKKIVLMGGITEPLIINGKNLDELNFSCDAEATCEILKSGCRVGIMTGHLCLQAYFSENEFNTLKRNHESNAYKYIFEKIEPWHQFIKGEFGIDGFYNWDIVAAVYMTNREVFEENIVRIKSTAKDLERGYIVIDSQEGSFIDIPQRIVDKEKFNELVFNAWNSVKLNNNKSKEV
jgi:inosine-uridine nucleoside N-ribohydrolase